MDTLTMNGEELGIGYGSAIPAQTYTVTYMYTLASPTAY